MAHCFDFRMRTSSFDLHQLATGNRLSKLGRLFRSKSEDEVKALRSPPSTSPKSSPQQGQSGSARRRFVRVVRNEESEGEEFENPHLVRRFTKEFWEEQQLEKSKSLDIQSDPERLPYTVSGNTILKKLGGSVDSDGSPPVTHKHACFKEDIEVFEFDKKSKIKKRCYVRHNEPLIDSSDTDSDSEFTKRREKMKGKKAPPMADYSSEEEETTAIVTDAIGEMCFTDSRRGELNLAFVPAIDAINGLCSPVKEEDEDSVTDTESELSDCVYDQDRAARMRSISTDSSDVDMESKTLSVQRVEEVAEGRKHEVES